MKRYGFFGGTFDPIHFGHLHLAIQILEKHQLDCIFFSPANFSPEKEGEMPTASKEARREMLRLALEPISKFFLFDSELKREGPSYTIDTIKHLTGEFPDVQFHLILGEDTLKGLPNWKEVESLLELAPPLIGTRPGAKLVKLDSQLSQKIERGKTEIPQIEISSTELRRRLGEKKYCDPYVPAKVLDYIEEHDLY